MSWLAAIALALAVFGAIAGLFKQPRAAWAVVLATLAFGLAGYATQASPGIASAPKRGVSAVSGEGRDFVELRKEIVGESRRSRSPYMLMADAWVREGKYEGAVTILRGVTRAGPHDGDAWLALGNVLFLHADAQFTPAALKAYAEAERAMPENAGPAFFVGLGLIREGKLIEAHRLWSERVESMPEGAPGREALARRLGNLEQVLRRIVEDANRSAGK